METVVKAKIGELEEEVRARCPRRMKNELNGVVQGILGNNWLLVRFQDGYENNLSSNQLTTVIVENIPDDKEPKVLTNSEILE